MQLREIASLEPLAHKFRLIHAAMRLPYGGRVSFSQDVEVLLAARVDTAYRYLGDMQLQVKLS